MPDLYLVYGLLLIVIIAIYFSLIALRIFEIVIALSILSIWIPHIYYSNASEGESIQAEGPGSYIRITIVLLLGIVGIIKYFITKNKSKFNTPLLLYTLGIFLLFALLSSIYSIDKQITLIRSVSFIALWCFLLGLYSWLKDDTYIIKTLNIIFYTIIFFAGLSFIGLLLMPSRTWLNGVDRFMGIWSHPNTMGAFCMSSFPLLFWKYKRTKRKYLIVLLSIIILYMLVITGSRTSLIGSIIGGFLWLILEKKYIFLIPFSLGLVVIIYFIFAVKPQSFSRPEGTEIVTGREQFWIGSAIKIMERPLYGYGYMVEGKIWEDPRFYKEGYELWSGSRHSSLHNGYLSVAVSLGVIGFLLWMVILLLPLFRVLFLPFSEFKSPIIVSIVMVLISNFFEGTLNGSNTFSTIVFWILAVTSYRISKLPSGTEYIR